MRITDELEHITANICRDDTEVKIVTSALKETLSIYQWEYQQSSDRAKRDITNELNRCLCVVKKQLKFLGQEKLIDDLEYVFEHSDAGSRKSNILTEAKRHMKDYCLNAAQSTKDPDTGNLIFKKVGIPSGRYKNEFAKSMETAFIEWCEQFPLNEPPAHLDIDFEPPIY